MATAAITRDIDGTSPEQDRMNDEAIVVNTMTL